MAVTGVLKPIIIFYCSVPEDYTLLKELDKHLAGVRRSGSVVTLYPDQILPGEVQEQAIEQLFLSADIILLLVSHHALNSDHWYKMMMCAMERQQKGELRVVPILLRSVEYSDTPFSVLTMLPSDKKAITSQLDSNSAFSEIAGSIRNIVEKMHELRTYSPSTVSNTHRCLSSKIAGDHVGRC